MRLVLFILVYFLLGKMLLCCVMRHKLELRGRIVAFCDMLREYTGGKWFCCTASASVLCYEVTERMLLPVTEHVSWSNLNLQASGSTLTSFQTWANAKTVRWRMLKSFIQLCDTSLRASSLRVTVISFIINKSINYRSAKKTSLYTLNFSPPCQCAATLPL